MTDEAIQKFNYNMRMLDCDVTIYNNKTCTIRIGNVNIEELRIPEGVEALAVGIGSRKLNTTLKRICLPDSLVAINRDSFMDYKGLEEIIGGKSVELVDNIAFKGCSNLKNAIFPKLKKIGNCAFLECFSLEAVDLGLVEEIGECSFESCKNLRSVKATKAVKILDGAFIQCCRLNEFIGNKVKNVSSRAFGICESLKKVEFAPESIGSAAFKRSGIEKIELSKARYIGQMAFSDSKLKGTIRLMSCEIGDRAFEWLDKISVEIGGVSRWEDSSFSVEAKHIIIKDMHR